MPAVNVCNDASDSEENELENESVCMAMPEDLSIKIGDTSFFSKIMTTELLMKQ